jgi:glutaredoxin
VTLTLYSKPGCHLCEDARRLLDELRGDFDFTIEEIDITRDAELFARYRYDIPVVTKDGVERLRGTITEQQLALLLRT